MDVRNKLDLKFAQNGTEYTMVLRPVAQWRVFDNDKHARAEIRVDYTITAPNKSRWTAHVILTDILLPADSQALFDAAVNHWTRLCELASKPTPVRDPNALDSRDLRHPDSAVRSAYHPTRGVSRARNIHKRNSWASA